jgi:hypothetical protein
MLFTQKLSRARLVRMLHLAGACLGLRGAGARIHFQMNDQLDGMSNAELDEIFTVEVAGFVPMDCMLHDVGAYRGAGSRERSDGKWIASHIPFCTNANAVLPWLEKHFIETEWCSPGQHHPRETHDNWRIRIPGVIAGDGRARTFARAAVLALIRAKRASK